MPAVDPVTIIAGAIRGACPEVSLQRCLALSVDIVNLFQEIPKLQTFQTSGSPPGATRI
jgi:hypothetical protein